MADTEQNGQPINTEHRRADKSRIETFRTHTVLRKTVAVGVIFQQWRYAHCIITFFLSPVNCAGITGRFRGLETCTLRHTGIPINLMLTLCRGEKNEVELNGLNHVQIQTC